MLEIRNIQIDGKADNRTDHLEPELTFALESDVPGTSLAEASVTVCGQTFDCGNSQTGFPLKGLALQPFTEYPVGIQVRDNHGQEAAAAASFRTGRLNLPWKASWITDKDYSFGKKQSPVPMTFRKCFPIEKPIRRAYITATAIGIYELKLNGEKVGDSYFAPGFTSYKKNLQYQFYDVTEQLACSNTLIAVVAGGWAVGRFTYENKNKIIAPRQALLLELFIEYTDGTAESIVTDSSWVVTLQGNYRKACLYDGEIYDASAGLEAVSWKHADATRLPFHPEIALENSHVICREILHPVSHFENGDGETIYDFGQNFAGVVELELEGQRGQTIIVRHAEVLDGDNLYTASLRTAKAELRYICKDGKAVCRRTEKGAAVAAAAYLSRQYPDAQGFSPRNLRRMRDFYRSYQDYPALLSLAMELGWTQNVVILESGLSTELREWYLKAAMQFGWSKAELQVNIASGLHEKIVLDADTTIKQKFEVCQTTYAAETAEAIARERNAYGIHEDANLAEAYALYRNMTAHGTIQRPETIDVLTYSVLRYFVYTMNLKKANILPERIADIIRKVF